MISASYIEETKHYPTYLILVISMIVSFLLGMLFVEMPFGIGLRYFSVLQQQNIIASKVRALQGSDARTDISMRTEAFQNVATCQTDYDSCTQKYTNAFEINAISEAAWLEGQIICAQEQSACINKAGGW